MIRKRKRCSAGKCRTVYVLLTSDGSRVLGVHLDAEGARRQEVAVRLSKLRAQGRVPPRR
jgi:hypothetical protein